MIAVLFSGGIDSLVHLRWAEEQFGRENVQPHYFVAGQSYADREISYAKPLAESLGYELVIKPTIQLPEDMVTGQIDLRNLIFLLHTATLRGCEGVVFGMLLAEAPVDKNPVFVARVQEIIDSQFAVSPYRKNKKKFRIYTPFRHMPKTEMLRWYLRKYGTEGVYESVACYTESGVMCGECISCFNRWLAFEANGLEMEKFKVHPADAMMQRISAIRRSKEHPNRASLSIGKAWKRRQWLWETYKALNKHSKVHYGRPVLLWLAGV